MLIGHHHKEMEGRQWHEPNALTVRAVILIVSPNRRSYAVSNPVCLRWWQGCAHL